MTIGSRFVQAGTDTNLFTAPSNWYYSFTITGGETTGSSPSPFCTLYKNGGEFLTVSYDGTATIWAYKWDVFTFWRANRKYTISATADFYASKWGSQIAKPRALTELWETAFLTLFWIHIDGSNFVWKESNTAVTWNITPGNFVGYVQLWNYKIPYYL